MNFDDFLLEHEKSMPEVNYDRNVFATGFMQVVRDYNSWAMMQPEKCEDFVLLDGHDIIVTDNPFRNKKRIGTKTFKDTGYDLKKERAMAEKKAAQRQGVKDRETKALREKEILAAEKAEEQNQDTGEGEEREDMEKPEKEKDKGKVKETTKEKASAK